MRPERGQNGQNCAQSSANLDRLESGLLSTWLRLRAATRRRGGFRQAGGGALRRPAGCREDSQNWLSIWRMRSVRAKKKEA